MKILQISDTHNKHHLLVNLPEADVIVHCGDFTDNGTEKEVLDFLNWFIMLPYKHKIFVTGNHDTCLWNAEAIEDLPKNVHFLQDSECKIEGISFFGLAYNHSEQVIPPDADVLVSHEPPFMILDKDNNIHWGNADLKKRYWRSNLAITFLAISMELTVQRNTMESSSQMPHYFMNLFKWKVISIY